MTRSEYMETSQEPGAFRRYYGQYVTGKIKNIVLHSIGKCDLLKSKDEHLNDIHLRRWDRMHASLPVETVKQLRDNGDSFSLGSSVCIFKEAARQTYI